MGGPTIQRDDIFDANGLEVAPNRPFNHGLWERLRQEQLGVDVVDPLGHQIGTAKAGNVIKYSPVDGFKHVIVGVFDHYGWYNPWHSGDEADFNIHISPDPPFAFLLTDVAKLMNEPYRDLQRAQRRLGFCVECEVTPDEHFYNNDYFPTDEPYTSPLEGRRLGLYGPWVRDEGHGGRPEIHPCEAIWWEEPANRPGVRFTRFFLILQDDSNRFDFASDYDGPIQRPWSASPRRANITVALQPRLGRGNRYQLRFIRSREVQPMANAGDNPIITTYQGQPAVTVEKITNRPNDIRVGVGQLAPDPDGEHLRCFLHIGVELGRGSRGEEGYALIRLETLA